jgi:CheY-like chemotaxis protein
MDKLARDLATAVEYDLILLDVQVPKLDGISLCRQLRSPGYRKSILMLTGNYSDAEGMDGFAVYDRLQSDPITRSSPMILLTAKVLPSDQAKFAQMAVAGVITKPIQPITLTEEVAEILGWVD